MTSIDEDGIGKILGGRSVKFEEVEKELGIKIHTYTRWIDKLEKYPYIKTIRAPYGIVFSVFKAKKYFKTDSTKKQRDSTKMSNPDSTKMSNVINTIQNTHNNDNSATQSVAGTSNTKYHDIEDFLRLFRVFHLAYVPLAKNKTEYSAAGELLNIHPFQWWAEFLPAYAVKMRTDIYCPRATRPHKILSKWAEIEAYATASRMQERKIISRGRGFA